VRVDNDHHPLKQYLPREVTVFEIEMDDCDKHSLKQNSSREVKEFGLRMDSKDEQP
jgi:hypothetical protein